MAIACIDEFNDGTDGADNRDPRTTSTCSSSRSSRSGSPDEAGSWRLAGARLPTGTPTISDHWQPQRSNREPER